MRRAAVKKSINHEYPGYCVWQIGLTGPMAEKLMSQIYCPDLHEFLGNHLSVSETGQDWTDLGCGRVRDEFGAVWDRSVDPDIGTLAGVVLEQRGDLKKMVWPDPDDDFRYDHLTAIIRESRDSFVLGGLGFSLFERAWILRGMENLLIDMVEAPEFVDELLDKILDYNLGIIENLTEFHVDGIRFGDDWGQQHGLIMGPALWRRFLKPRLARMYAAVKEEKDLPVFIHSCGDVREIFPDLIEIGVDVFNPFQPEVMDIYEMKETYGDRLSFYGGISTQKTLPFGTPADVRRETERAIEFLGRNGGYICSPAHEMPKDVPVENLLALVDVLKNQ